MQVPNNIPVERTTIWSSDEFHNSIDRQLSGLKPDPWLAQHIMASAKEEEPVKKFTVSTALIVVLIVIASTKPWKLR